MKLFGKDLARDVVVIAEIGNNHEGNLELACELTERAADAGADAVKFQTFDPAHYISRSDTARFERLQKFRLPADAWARLSKLAAERGIHFFSTPFDLGSVDVLLPYVDVFKIASGDNTFYPLIDKIVDTEKPILLSTGLLDYDGVSASAHYITNQWHAKHIDPGLAILHCVTSYPTSPAEANIAAITQLAKLGRTVGYSDHTVSNESAVLAVAAGARIIEKHFTIDKHHSEFRDHQLSADPKQMAELVTRVAEAVELLGTAIKSIQPSERQTAPLVRRSIVASKDLPAAHTIQWADLTWIRPAGGLPPGAEARIVGRRLRRAVGAGEQLTPEMLDG